MKKMIRKRSLAGFTPLETTGQSVKIKMSLTGFTLIELIVVIAIIAIISGLGLTSFSTLSGDRLEGDARKIVNDLSWLRQMAAAGNQYIPAGSRQNYIAVFNTVNETYTVYQGSTIPSNLIKTQSLSPGVNLVSVLPLPAQVTFNFPQGTAQDKTITLTSQGKTRTVSVFSNTGYVRIQ